MSQKDYQPKTILISDGLILINRERTRQVLEENFSGVHDQQHRDEALVYAAIHYATPEADKRNGFEQIKRTRQFRDLGEWTGDAWPEEWDKVWDKKDRKTRIEQLAIAGALIAAEIDRLVRSE